MARALGPGLAVETLHCFFAALDRKRTGWREVKDRNDAANNRAMEVLVFDKVREHRIRASPGESELHGTFAKTVLQFIKIHVEPDTRITDEHDRFGLDVPPRFGPQIARVVQGRLVA